MYQSISFSQSIKLYVILKEDLKGREFNIITVEDQPVMDDLVLV